MRFVDAHDLSVGLVLRVLNVPASTYYDCRARVADPAQRRREDIVLLALIKEIRARSGIPEQDLMYGAAAERLSPVSVGEPYGSMTRRESWLITIVGRTRTASAVIGRVDMRRPITARTELPAVTCPT